MTITQRLRNLWTAGDFKEFTRAFELAKWLIPEEDRLKILEAIKNNPEALSFSKITEEDEMFKEVNKAFPGTKIV